MNVLAPSSASLRDPRVASVLDRLHADAKRDRWRAARVMPRIVGGVLAGRGLWGAALPNLKTCYLSISREQGTFLYLLARATGARRIVEYGSSFGVSTIYLAAATRDNGGEPVVGTELEPEKHRRATENLGEAGLSDFAAIRLGDARETLRDVVGPIDLVFLDGWKDIYLSVLDLLRPRLRPGAVVVSDNVWTFKRALAPFVAHVQSGANGFLSTTVPYSSGFELSVAT
jgi:predicted O-methyltransferase YrrM